MRPAPDAHFDQLIKIDLHFLAAGIVILFGLADEVANQKTAAEPFAAVRGVF